MKDSDKIRLAVIPLLLVGYFYYWHIQYDDIEKRCARFADGDFPVTHIGKTATISRKKLADINKEQTDSLPFCGSSDLSPDAIKDMTKTVEYISGVSLDPKVSGSVGDCSFMRSQGHIGVKVEYYLCRDKQGNAVKMTKTIVSDMVTSEK